MHVHRKQSSKKEENKNKVKGYIRLTDPSKSGENNKVSEEEKNEETRHEETEGKKRK